MSGTPPLLMERSTFRVTGMTCAACAARIEKSLGRMEGVDGVTVNLAMERMSVAFDRHKVGAQQIGEKVRQLGYGLQPVAKEDGGNERDGDEERNRLRNRFLLSALFTLPLLWTMFGHWSFTSGVWMPDLLMDPWFQFAMAAPVQFVFGMQFYTGAFRALRGRTANMDVLIALSTSVAFFYSHYLTATSASGHGPMHGADPHAGHVPLYYESSAMIITIVHLGKWLEALAKKRTLTAIRRLHELQSKTVTLQRGSEEVQVPLEQVKAGDTVLIRPGEKVPVDGRVLSGSSIVDEAPITGETDPADKRAGDLVIAGTINKTGALRVFAMAVGDQSTVAKMVRLLEEAQSSKPSIQRMADRIASVFVPVIVALAAGTFAYWYYVAESSDTATAVVRAITVLVIACPCAIGLATPTSVLVGTGRAAQQGILFKEGRHLEQMHRIDTVILDKTGTITDGTPKLIELSAASGTREELLRFAAAAEWSSEHPLARSIVAAAVREGLDVPEAVHFEAIPGYGVWAVADDREVYVGTRQLLQQQGVVPREDPERIGKLEANRMSVLFVAVNGRYAGFLALQDTIPQTSKEAVKRLGRLGLDVIMMTGDNERTAKAIAAEMGIRQLYANVLPEGKVAVVRKLQQNGRRVAMVGDGMNDAAALGAADIGIAVGSGTDMAIEAADVTLLKRNLTGVPESVRIGRMTITNIRQNLLFALVYNVLAIPFAASGVLEPWMAGTAMTLSSISVVCNALRLHRKA
ncbi:copper-translocating P-type ATPase [Paenibacillus hemerocallicola]|uniref:P-type Cu(+) transporter n=1 Tax=Paenibacillus hemerocallicola TaxID=1172614 RepID=A0A5C4TFS1_9BACL|nr:heavy metal translocating P-type ATPase [Paenibacillus hemerocallicola]TNJ67279.1 copper-translocating P-type ATPase [Paenibacillus hemerocallicola]